ncbi:NADP-dependent oxidoreductase [Chryseobacterium gleum]|uniref:NADP-dependent oxidoreductase n=1 Tax=Chryseobacterium gleum TaxID=250 RepID=UPI001E4362B9|nr:NADP-dependent oxidoreductase [Chryseobacterium gleum]MCE4067138.1 NADP-dependent oxidoreductase [Chryseobacterium gleum]
MKAIILKSPGDVDQLEYTELPIPETRPDEVLIKVKAISINPVDTKTRKGEGMYGLMKKDHPLILGWDISGIVEKSKSSDFKVGDEVFGMLNFPGNGNAYAEYVVAPASQLAIKPKNISFEEAAASTLAALTSWQALVVNGKVQKGQNVLIHAASGGVGHFAVQLAKYLGATVTGTSSAKNKDFVLSLGVDHYIDYHTYDWLKQKSEYDFVLDTVGGNNINNSIEVTKSGGTIISIPTALNEEITEKAKSKDINSYFILVKSNGEHMKEIASLLENKTIKPHISTVFSFDEIKKAHLQLESGRTVGKVVVV